MRSITLIAILALASLCANAAPLPSSISGAYLTPERVCRVEAFRWTDPRWTLSVVVGLDPSAVANGIGTPQTWQLVESIASRAPYTCATAQSLRFRVFGR